MGAVPPYSQDDSSQPEALRQPLPRRGGRDARTPALRTEVDRAGDHPGAAGEVATDRRALHQPPHPASRGGDDDTLPWGGCVGPLRPARSADRLPRPVTRALCAGDRVARSASVRGRPPHAASRSERILVVDRTRWRYQLLRSLAVGSLELERDFLWR